MIIYNFFSPFISSFFLFLFLTPSLPPLPPSHPPIPLLSPSHPLFHPPTPPFTLFPYSFVSFHPQSVNVLFFSPSVFVTAYCRWDQQASCHGGSGVFPPSCPTAVTWRARPSAWPQSLRPSSCWGWPCCRRSYASWAKGRSEGGGPARAWERANLALLPRGRKGDSKKQCPREFGNMLISFLFCWCRRANERNGFRKSRKMLISLLLWSSVILMLLSPLSYPNRKQDASRNLTMPISPLLYPVRRTKEENMNGHANTALMLSVQKGEIDRTLR